MRCKDFKKHIDLYIDHELEPLDVQRLEDHLSHCSECKQYYRERNDIDTKLLELHEASTYNTDIDDYVINNLTRSNKKRYLAVAVVLLMLTFTFNQELLLFAEKLPIVDELFSYFSKDKGIEEIESVGIQTYEDTYTTDDHKLVVDDFYWDGYKLYFKFALLDLADNAIHDYSWNIKINNYEHQGFPGALSMDPWSVVDLQVLQDLTSETFTLELKDEAKTIVFEEIPLSSRMVEIKPIELPQNMTLNVPGGMKYIKDFTISPLSMFLTMASFDENTYLANLLIDYYLEDNLGNQYHPTNHRIELDGVRTIEFRPSIFHRDVESLKLVINRVNSIAVEPVISGTPDWLINKSFNHKDFRLGDFNATTNKLTITDIEFDYRLLLTLESDDVLVSRNFPRLCVWDGQGWTEGYETEIPVNHSLIKTSLPQLKKFLKADFEYLAFDDETLILLDTLDNVDPSYKVYDEKRQLEITKVQLQILIDKEKLEISEEALDEFSTSWNMYRFTKGEFEAVIGHPLEMLSEDPDLELESIRKLIKYLNAYTFKEHNNNSINDYIKQLLDTGEITIAYEAEVSTNRVVYEFYNITDHDFLEFSTVSDFEIDNIIREIELKIKPEY